MSVKMELMLQRKNVAHPKWPVLSLYLCRLLGRRLQREMELSLAWRVAWDELEICFSQQGGCDLRKICGPSVPVNVQQPHATAELL